MCSHSDWVIRSSGERKSSGSAVRSGIPPSRLGANDSSGKLDMVPASRLTHAHTVLLVSAMSGLAATLTLPLMSAPRNGGIGGGGNSGAARTSRPRKSPTRTSSGHSVDEQ